VTEQLTDSEVRHSRLVTYILETRTELKKVVWPTRDQAINLTVVVLTVVLVMTGILWGIDAVFAQFFKLLLS